MSYRVTHTLVLTTKQKFCFSMRPIYLNYATFVLVSTGCLDQGDVSPCISVLVDQIWVGLDLGAPPYYSAASNEFPSAQAELGIYRLPRLQ